MEQPVVGAPVATTPETGGAAFGGQLPEPNAAVQGQAPDQPQQQVEQATEPDYFLRAETGTVYKTAEAAAAGIAEKDRYIESLQRQLAGLNQQQPQPQAAPDPQVAINAEIASVAQSIEQRLMQNPKWRNAGIEAIREEAELQAYSVVEARQLARQDFQQQFQQQQHQQFLQNTPMLHGPEAAAVWDAQVRTTGRGFNTPQEHLQAVKAYLFDQKFNGGNTAVHGAMQQQQRQPIFGTPQASGQPPAEQMPPHVARAVEYARSRGVTDPAELEQIKKAASGMDMNRFNKGSF